MPRTLGSDLGSLLRSGLFADAEIVLRDGRSMKVHKNVLASRSEFFSNALNPDFGFEESKSGVIRLIEDPPQAVERMIQFLYTSAYLPNTSQPSLDKDKAKAKGKGEEEDEEENRKADENESDENESDENEGDENESEIDDGDDDENDENESQDDTEIETENNPGNDDDDDNVDTVLLHLHVYVVAHKYMIPELCDYSRTRAMHVRKINQDVLQVIQKTYSGLNPILEDESWRRAVVWLGARLARNFRCKGNDFETATMSLVYPNFWLDVTKFLAERIIAEI